MKNKMTFILLTTILMLTGCGTKIEQSADTTTIEAGSDFSFVVTDFFTCDKSDALNEIIADTSKVDTGTVGSYPVTVTYKKDTYTITVNVVDTVAPTIKLKEELPVVAEGDVVNAVDFVDVEDITACKIFFVQSDNTEVEELTISEGSNVFNIVAEDENNNRSETVEYIVEIESVVNEKQEEQIQEEPSKGTSYDDLETNWGKGWDVDGIHYDTKTELIEAEQAKIHAAAVASGAIIMSGEDAKKVDDVYFNPQEPSDTNDGKGYDFQGIHYDTWGPYSEAVKNYFNAERAKAHENLKNN